MLSVGVDAKSDLVYDVFPLEYLIENGHKIEISDTALKVIPPVKRTGCEDDDNYYSYGYLSYSKLISRSFGETNHLWRTR